MGLKDAGFEVFAPTQGGVRWADAARRVAARLSAEPGLRARNLRHGQTWFVGVDALPNGPDGAIDGVPLPCAWQHTVPELALHRAQLSIIYPGYPGRDATEGQGAQRYRLIRAAAHVDGLLPVGEERRRYALEFHAYILGLPLNRAAQAPTLVWPGSHKVMYAALRAAIGSNAPDQVDVTDAYQAARKRVFETCDPVPLRVPPGGAFLLHRFALHGTAPWEGPVGAARMVAFLRPVFARVEDWLGN